MLNKRFTISGFADEIDPSVDRQFAHLKTLGISYFEPRGIDGKNISELTDSEVKELAEKMEGSGIKVSSVGSPIGKIAVTDPMEPHLALLRRVIRTAKMLNAPYIRIFSFYIPEGDDPASWRDEVLKRMRAMVDLAEAEGVVLLHENEKGIYGDIAPRCLDLLENIRSEAFGCVFDPANFVQVGQQVYPEAYQMLEPYITYMHIKDALADGTVVPAGYGIGGVEQVLTGLFKKDWKGFVSLEPHLGSFAGLAALEQSDEMLALPESGPEKFTLAYEALKTILERIEING